MVIVPEVLMVRGFDKILLLEVTQVFGLDQVPVPFNTMFVVPDDPPPQLPPFAIVKPPLTLMVFPLTTTELLFESEPFKVKVPNTVIVDERVKVEVQLPTQVSCNPFGHVSPLKLSVDVVTTFKVDEPAIVIVLTNVTFPLTVSRAFIVSVLV
jgi:hypothetical protein